MIVSNRCRRRWLSDEEAGAEIVETERRADALQHVEHVAHVGIVGEQRGLRDLQVQAARRQTALERRVSETRLSRARSVSNTAEILTATAISPGQVIASMQASISTHSVRGLML